MALYNLLKTFWPESHSIAKLTKMLKSGRISLLLWVLKCISKKVEATLIKISLSSRPTAPSTKSTKWTNY